MNRGYAEWACACYDIHYSWQQEQAQEAQQEQAQEAQQEQGQEQAQEAQQEQGQEQGQEKQASGAKRHKQEQASAAGASTGEKGQEQVRASHGAGSGAAQAAPTLNPTPKTMPTGHQTRAGPREPDLPPSLHQQCLARGINPPPPAQ